MKNHWRNVAFLLFVCLIVCAVCAQSPKIHLIDETGSFFIPTNAAKVLNAMDAADIRGGSQLLNAGELTKAITFATPMKDASYIVLATPRLPTGVSWSNPTTNGFMLNLTVGIAGRVDWLAINP